MTRDKMMNAINLVAAKEVETVIIGAGPVGLFQVFELGLLGMRAHIIDSLEEPGGQCSALYPEKPIYDIPACPAIKAQQLTDNLLEQIAPFEPVFHLGEQVTSLSHHEGRFVVSTDKGTVLHTQSVIIAAGMGMFKPIKLRVPEIEKFEEQSVHYKITHTERFRGKHLVVLGGGDSAIDWVLSLQDIAASVTHVHRSTKFRAAPASVEKMQLLCDQQLMQSLVGQVSDYVEKDGQLAAIKIIGNDGVTRILELDDLLVFYGQSPDMEVINSWNLDMHKNQIKVDTEKFQTSQQGIYAVGDINWYPGKKKLILSGFHESALAAFAIKEQLHPDKKVHLQYTTTSPIMHQRLKVEDIGEQAA